MVPGKDFTVNVEIFHDKLYMVSTINALSANQSQIHTRKWTQVGISLLMWKYFMIKVQNLHHLSSLSQPETDQHKKMVPGRDFTDNVEVFHDK
jgi:hypothetical protein